MVPRCRLSTVGSRSFSVAGPTIWNRLPTDITSASCLSVFKRKLKTHLVQSTETALLRIWSDMLMAADGRKVALLGLLDMSAAFDCVDH